MVWCGRGAPSTAGLLRASPTSGKPLGAHHVSLLKPRRVPRCLKEKHRPAPCMGRKSSLRSRQRGWRAANLGFPKRCLAGAAPAPQTSQGGFSAAEEKRPEFKAGTETAPILQQLQTSAHPAELGRLARGPAGKRRAAPLLPHLHPRGTTRGRHRGHHAPRQEPHGSHRPFLGTSRDPGTSPHLRSQLWDD